MRLQPANRTELQELLRAGAHPHVTLRGTGSRAARRPLPEVPAPVLSLAALCAIERLDAGDLTCSVQPGVRRADLDAALAPHGLELPCAGDGSVGGLFAADEIGALAPGAPSPRTLLLGLEGVLADGTAFKTGARVVKSVAGFDVHKLFVGGHGRLFAATLLHLKLRPRARAAIDFVRDELTADAALAAFTTARRLPAGLQRLGLIRDRGAWSVRGRVGGRISHVRALMQQLLATEAADPAPDLPPPVAGCELLTGIIRCSRLAEMLPLLPAEAPFVLHGGGRFATWVPGAVADALLAALPRLDGSAVIAGAAAGRRGRATANDPGSERLTAALCQQLDPNGVFV